MQEIIPGMGPFFLNLGQYTKSERLLSWESFILFPEKAMATHSSILAWRIPGAVEPGGLPSMGSHRVGQDWSNLAAAYSFQKSKICPITLKIGILKSSTPVKVLG